VLSSSLTRFLHPEPSILGRAAPAAFGQGLLHFGVAPRHRKGLSFDQLSNLGYRFDCRYLFLP
jgi:hypothetical protein